MLIASQPCVCVISHARPYPTELALRLLYLSPLHNCTRIQARLSTRSNSSATAIKRSKKFVRYHRQIDPHAADIVHGDLAATLEAHRASNRASLIRKIDWSASDPRPSRSAPGETTVRPLLDGLNASHLPVQPPAKVPISKVFPNRRSIPLTPREALHASHAEQSRPWLSPDLENGNHR